MGIQSQSYAVLDFGRLGRLGCFGRADAVRVEVSQPLLSLCRKKRQQISTNFNKFQQISSKSFASRRSLTAKSCRPIGNKKKPSTHAPTSHRTHTHAHTTSCRRQLPSMLFSSRSRSPSSKVDTKVELCVETKLLLFLPPIRTHFRRRFSFRTEISFSELKLKNQ
jgi:hypothetical protein